MFANDLKKHLALPCALLLALVLVGASSCKKDDEKTLEELIADGTWKLAAITVGGAPQALDPCDTDDITTFHDNGEYHLDEGATKCDEFDPQETTGTWSISESTTPPTLSVTESGSPAPEEYDITLLNKDSLVLTIENVPIFGTIVTTFEKY